MWRTFVTRSHPRSRSASSGTRATAAQWRDGAELGTAFPCDDGKLLVLLMPPRERVPEFAGDPAGEYERTIARSLPELHARLEGCTRATKVRFATDLPSYFRHSSGPGWALPGDAGHFKDPVTAQGIRDAVRFGRLLGEAAAPVLDDPRALDGALQAWEKHRERECLEAYQWTNRLARADAISPLEVELYRDIAADPAQAQRLLDVFSRTARPADALPPRRSLALAVRALRRPGADRREVLRTGVRELMFDARQLAARI